MSYTTVNTAGISRAEWLAMRRTGIGGSDAAKILLTPKQYTYADPAALYLDKIGEGGDTDVQTIAARHGAWCEEFVARLWEETTGHKVHRVNKMFRSVEHPFMIADIDRKLVGVQEGLECKTIGELAARRYIKDPETGEGSWIDRFVEDDAEATMMNQLHWYCQIQHYMAVTGWNMWHLGVLIGNKRFLAYDIPRNQEWIEEVIKQEADFWDHVIKRENIWTA